MTWLRSKLSFLQYLSLHIIWGFILSFLCLALFSELAEAVLEQKFLVSFDELIANSFYRNINPNATSFFVFVTRFGFEWLWLFFILIAVYFVFKRQWAYLFVLIIAVGGGQYLNASLKLFFSRPRPNFDDPILILPDYSFPSGHAMLSFIAYGLIAYFLFIETSNKLHKLLSIIIAALIIALIGLSRIYLGVHYLSDVIAGFAAGGFWLSSCITTLHLIRPRFHRKDRENTENH